MGKYITTIDFPKWNIYLTRVTGDLILEHSGSTFSVWAKKKYEKKTFLELIWVTLLKRSNWCKSGFYWIVTIICEMRY